MPEQEGRPVTRKVSVTELEIELLAALHVAGPVWRKWSGADVAHFMAHYAVKYFEGATEACDE